MKKIVLVTGVTGFVGKQVLRHLCGEDISLRLVLRENSDCSIADSKIESIIYTTNLFAENKDWWMNCLKGVDTFIHLAWYAKPGSYLNSYLNLECYFGTLNIAKAVVESCVRRFIGVGTCLEYKSTNIAMNITDPLVPNTQYGLAKRATYCALQNIFRDGGVEFSWCRLFYLYGQYEQEDRLFPYIENSLKLGISPKIQSANLYRDYLDVSVAGMRISKIALSDYVGPANICSGIPLALKEVALHFANKFDRPDLVRIGESEDGLQEQNFIYGIPTLIE